MTSAHCFIVGVVAVMSAVMLVACSGGAGPAASVSSGPASSVTRAVSTAQGLAVSQGVELTVGQIPWNRVGPGWILATWSPAPSSGPGQRPSDGPPAATPVTLYLLDPAGPRYAITTLPVVPSTGTGDYGHVPLLVDWSGDGRRALFEDFGPEPAGHDAVNEVDLTTGISRSITIQGHSLGYGGAYGRPTGQTIIESTSNGLGRGPTLERLDLNGNRQFIFPTGRLGAAGNYDGEYLQSPDGKQLVLGTDHGGLVLMGDHGEFGRRLPMPGGLTDCHPLRWWSPTTILAQCGVAPSGSQLWQVPVSGGPASAVTAVNNGNDRRFADGNDMDDVDAWRLPIGTFLASMRGCGAGFLTRLTPDRHTAAVSVPGVKHSDDVVVIGATSDKLLLSARTGCGPGISLLSYDPAADTSTVVLGPAINGGTVDRAILYSTE